MPLRMVSADCTSPTYAFARLMIQAQINRARTTRTEDICCSTSARNTGWRGGYPIHGIVRQISLMFHRNSILPPFIAPGGRTEFGTASQLLAWTAPRSRADICPTLLIKVVSGRTPIGISTFPRIAFHSNPFSFSGLVYGEEAAMKKIHRGCSQNLQNDGSIRSNRREINDNEFMPQSRIPSRRRLFAGHQEDGSVNPRYFRLTKTRCFTVDLAFGAPELCGA